MSTAFISSKIFSILRPSPNRKDRRLRLRLVAETPRSFRPFADDPRACPLCPPRAANNRAAAGQDHETRPEILSKSILPARGFIICVRFRLMFGQKRRRRFPDKIICVNAAPTSGLAKSRSQRPNEFARSGVRARNEIRYLPFGSKTEAACALAVGILAVFPLRQIADVNCSGAVVQAFRVVRKRESGEKFGVTFLAPNKPKHDFFGSSGRARRTPSIINCRSLKAISRIRRPSRFP